jgi:hypothetical protein
MTSAVEVPHPLTAQSNVDNLPTASPEDDRIEPPSHAPRLLGLSASNGEGGRFPNRDPGTLLDSRGWAPESVDNFALRERPPLALFL